MTLTELADKEAELYSLVIELYDRKENMKGEYLNLNQIQAEYKKIHIEYAKMSETNIESLKRGLFIQWCAITEPDYLTGIAELDQNAEVKIITELKKRINQNNGDNELKSMLNYYLDWNHVFDRFKNIAEFEKDENTTDLTNGILKMVNRGQMGVYWNSIIDR